MATVLLVDDDDLMARSERYGLLRAGYHVLLAASLREALARLEECQPDVVIVDINPPDGDGLELGRQLRDRGLPFLFVTAQAAGRDAGLALGAQDYLVKPIGLDELTARVGMVVRRSKPDVSPGANRP